MKTCHQATVYPGNVAKYRLLLDLQDALRRRPDARILDVGCVGPGTPLELWTPLLSDPAYRFHLTGIDVAGLDAAAERVGSEGWEGRVELASGSAYDIARRFGGAGFDLVVSTQVLEHLARYRRFVAGLPEVLRPDGEAMLTLDSAHFGGKYPLDQPVVAVKRLAKKALAALGREGHYDVPLYDRDLEACLERAGLAVRTRRYHNLGPMKRLHNHVVDPSIQDAFLVKLWELEEAVNSAERFGDEEKRLFRCLYYHVQRTSSGGVGG